MRDEFLNFRDCRRLGFLPARSSRFYEPANSVAESARCHIFNSNSSSSTDARSGADNEAILATGAGAGAKDEAVSTTGQGVSAKDQALSLGGYGTKNTLGSDLSGGQGFENIGGVSLGGYANKNLLGGVEVGGANSGTINIGDTKGVELIADKFATTVESLAAAKPVAATTPATASVTDDTPRERATDQNSFVWWSLGILGTIAIGLWLRSRKKSA